MNAPVLDIRDLRTVFRVGGRELTAVADLDLSIAPGETVALVGPSTQARPAPVPQDAEFLGVPFAPGTFLSSLPPAHALNGGLTLPLASSRAFWLNGSAIPIPHEDELDAFVTRLSRRGELQHSDVVERVLQGLPLPASLRTVQRQFLHATGLSSRQFEQIRRASEAAQLLRQGRPIADVVVLCRYSDQPHLTRALRRYWGQMPAQLRASPYFSCSAPTAWRVTPSACQRSLPLTSPAISCALPATLSIMPLAFSLFIMMCS